MAEGPNKGTMGGRSSTLGPSPYNVESTMDDLEAHAIRLRE